MSSLINDQVPSTSLPSKGSGSTHNQTTEPGGNKGREALRALALIQETALPRGSLVSGVVVVGVGGKGTVSISSVEATWCWLA